MTCSSSHATPIMKLKCAPGLQNDVDTFVELTDPPGALTVPEQAQNHQRYDLLLMKLLRLLENEPSSLFSPVNHEAVILQCSFAVLVSVETKNRLIDPNACLQLILLTLRPRHRHSG